MNVLSAARFFLFGARDIWFVVGVPVFLSSTLGWGFTEVGSFLALWVVGYGVIQSVAPALIGRWTGGRAPQGRAAQVLAFVLAAVTAMIAVGLRFGDSPAVVILGGLGVFGIYYMANAGGRLVGTLLSGLVFQASGLGGCLWTSAGFAIAAGALSLMLPRKETALRMAEMKADTAN